MRINEEHRTKKQSIACVANKELESIAPTPCISDLVISCPHVLFVGISKSRTLNENALGLEDIALVPRS